MKTVQYRYLGSGIKGISTIDYDFTDQEWLNFWTQYPAIKHNNWYNSLPNRTHEIFNRAKAKIEFLKARRVGANNTSVEFTVNTARLCPNIREFLARCMVIRAPMDMHFNRVSGKLLNREGVDYVYDFVAAEPNMLQLDVHDPIQFRSDACDTFHDHTNIKMNTGLAFNLPKNMQCMFLQPLYDNPDAPFQVIQGVFTEPLNHSAHIIWNVMVNNKKVEDFIIKKGDALMYVYFPERVKFVKAKKPFALVKTQFNKPMGLVSDEVQQKCPMEIK